MTTPVAAARADRSARNGIVVDPRSRGGLSLAIAAYLPLIALPLVAVAIVGPMLMSRLGAVDDYWIPVLQRQVAAIGPLDTWRQTDLDTGRFRPLYWVGWIAETTLWGDNATGWHFDRLVLMIATMASVHALARLWMPSVAAAIVAVLVVAGPQSEAFYQLGPQESYGMALTAVGLALVGRRRWAGLLPIVLAAFTKEAFVISAVVGVAWAWSLGSRRAALAAGAVLLVVGAVILTKVISHGGDYYTAQGLAIPAAGRYLFPFVLLPALGIGALVAKYRALMVPAGFACVLAVGYANGAAVTWAASTQTFAATVDELSLDPRPLVIVVPNPGSIEIALAVRTNLPDRPMELVSPASLPGFSDVGGSGCLELDVQTQPIGACPEARSLP